VEYEYEEKEKEKESGGPSSIPSIYPDFVAEAATRKMESLLKDAIKRKPNTGLPEKINDAGGTFPTNSCEHREAQDLVLCAKFSELGLPLFQDRGMDISELDLMPSAKKFVPLLKGLASQVFGVSPGVLALFVNGTHRVNISEATIAFNLQGRIYFNIVYFLDHHFTVGKRGILSEEEIGYYWFITFAHELAHNLVIEHNQLHENITQELEAKYFLAFCKFLGLSSSC